MQRCRQRIELIDKKQCNDRNESVILILPSRSTPRNRPTIRPYAMIDIQMLRSDIAAAEQQQQSMMKPRESTL
jgi:hypothetical protein